MTPPDALLERYAAAIRVNGDVCHADPTSWHAPNADEFSKLFDELLPHANAGHVDCEYALATILWLGLRCKTEGEMMQEHRRSIVEASFWWERAASKGHWPAMDNLIGSGVGELAERARKAFHEPERSRPNLVGNAMGMPVYGPSIMNEVIGIVFERE